MNQASRGSRVVFGIKSKNECCITNMYTHAVLILVGNIPFELSEEQLIEVFKEVGPVASFR